MPMAPVNGTDLYYRVDGEGPAVVFAHGRASTHLSWCQQVPAFADRYQVVTYDARGFGQSPDPTNGDPGMPSHLADLEGLVDHLDVESVFLVAQSMGGLAAMQYAVAHPERTRGLVLTSTPAGIDDEKVVRGVADTKERYADLPLPDRVFRPGFVEHNPQLLHMWFAQQDSSPPYPPSFLAPLLEGGGPSADDLAGLEVPTLVITARYDALVSPEVGERMCELIPDSQLAVAEDCGHCVYWERPIFYNRTIREFLDGHS